MPAGSFMMPGNPIWHQMQKSLIEKMKALQKFDSPVEKIESSC